MFRLFSLLRVVAAAEGLRWRRTGRGYARQAGLAAAAAGFALMLLAMLHVAALAWLSPVLGGALAALAIGAADLALMLVLAGLAARAAHDPIASEAVRLRDDALRQIGDQATRGALLLPLLRSQTAKKGLVGAALTAAVVGLMTRR